MSTKIYREARAEALRRAELVARQNPGHTITRVAVTVSEYGVVNGYEVTTRAMYEEACSESEWIGQAVALCEGGEVHSDFET